MTTPLACCCTRHAASSTAVSYYAGRRAAVQAGVGHHLVRDVVDIILAYASAAMLDVTWMHTSVGVAMGKIILEEPPQCTKPTFHNAVEQRPTVCVVAFHGTVLIVDRSVSASPQPLSDACKPRVECQPAIVDPLPNSRAVVACVAPEQHLLYRLVDEQLSSCAWPFTGWTQVGASGLLRYRAMKWLIYADGKVFALPFLGDALVVFDIVSQQWSLQDLPKTLLLCRAAAAFHGRLTLFGPSMEHKAFAEPAAFCLEPLTCVWTPYELSHDLDSFTAVTVGDTRLLLIGTTRKPTNELDMHIIEYDSMFIQNAHWPSFTPLCDNVMSYNYPVVSEAQ